MTGDEFDKACHAIGIKTQTEASVFFGLSQGQISRMKRDSRPVSPLIERLIALCQHPSIGNKVTGYLRAFEAMKLFGLDEPAFEAMRAAAISPPPVAAKKTVTSPNLFARLPDGSPDIRTRAKDRNLPFWEQDDWDDDAEGRERPDEYDYYDLRRSLMTPEELETERLEIERAQQEFADSDDPFG